MKGKFHIALQNILEEIYDEYYLSEEKGFFDFPTKEEWMKDKIQSFKKNNRKLINELFNSL